MDTFLSQSTTYELIAEQEQWLDLLSQQVRHSSLTIFSELEDIAGSSKQKFKGKVDNQDFKLKTVRQVVDSINYTLLEGTCEQQGEKLLIHCRFQALSGLMLVVLAAFLLFIPVNVLVFLVNMPFAVTNLLVVVVVSLLPFVVSYWLMRRNLRRMRREFEASFID
jgi:Flp pilus assembly protein TadB